MTASRVFFIIVDFHDFFVFEVVFVLKCCFCDFPST